VNNVSSTACTHCKVSLKGVRAIYMEERTGMPGHGNASGKRARAVPVRPKAISD
jgi:hypothetical protein